MQSGQELIRTSGSPPISRANCLRRLCRRSLFSAASSGGQGKRHLAACRASAAPAAARRASPPRGCRRRASRAEDARPVELARRDQGMRADADFLVGGHMAKGDGQREKRARRVIDADQVGVDDRVVRLLGAIVGMGAPGNVRQQAGGAAAGAPPPPSPRDGSSPGSRSSRRTAPPRARARGTRSRLNSAAVSISGSRARSSARQALEQQALAHAERGDDDRRGFVLADDLFQHHRAIGEQRAAGRRDASIADSASASMRSTSLANSSASRGGIT